MWDSQFYSDNDSAEFIEYRKQVQYLLGWYDRYIRMKLLGDSEELASFMTAYPEGGDVVTARDFEEQKKAWFFRETKEIHRDEKEVEAEKAKKTVQDAKQKLKTDWRLAQKVRYLSMHWSWIIPGFTRNIYPRILQPSWKITGSEITCPGTGFPITFHSVFTSEIPSATCFFQRKTSCFSFLKKPEKRAYR